MDRLPAKGKGEETVSPPETLPALYQKGIKKLRLDAKDKKIASRMRNRKAGSQALNGIRIEVLATMKGMTERLEYVWKSEETGKRWDEILQLMYEYRDLNWITRLVNLVDAMNQNQIRQREELEKFIQAYLRDDKPAVREIAENLAALRKETKEVLKHKKTLRFMEFLVNDFKPPTEKDGGDSSGGLVKP
jgi:hypothetical protein